MTKKAKKKASEPAEHQQLKIEGTGRLDAIPEIEEQAEACRQASADRAAAQQSEFAALDELTELLKKHDRKEYVYQDEDGEKYRAFVPSKDVVRAKVRRVKPNPMDSDE